MVQYDNGNDEDLSQLVDNTQATFSTRLMNLVQAVAAPLKGMPLVVIVFLLRRACRSKAHLGSPIATSLLCWMMGLLLRAHPKGFQVCRTSNHGIRSDDHSDDERGYVQLIVQLAVGGGEGLGTRTEEALGESRASPTRLAALVEWRKRCLLRLLTDDSIVWMYSHRTTWSTNSSPLFIHSLNSMSQPAHHYPIASSSPPALISPNIQASTSTPLFMTVEVIELEDPPVPDVDQDA
ncbi:hypothetical protein B0O80DRAFT_485157 [Mortierella sp. GBAus27b]|nr:hypothetical protein B0O80DRAFT_485157 [Mortierella sp. GBAus27b]